MLTFSNGTQYYKFSCVGKKAGDGNFINEVYIYSFKSPKTGARYIAEVEHYHCDIYAIKFYLKTHQASKDRFNELTNFNEARPVINTCIAILVDIFEKDPKASFAFIGSPSPKEIEREKEKPSYRKENCTQRFRIYSTLMYTYFSETYFEHRSSPQYSLYLMRNKRTDCTLKAMQDMMNSLYDIDMNDLQ